MEAYCSAHACSITASNGEGNGELVDGFGFMLNNVLGEDDVGKADTDGRKHRHGDVAHDDLVDLGGVDGLVHVTESAHHSLDAGRDLLSLGANDEPEDDHHDQGQAREARLQARAGGIADRVLGPVQ